MTACSSGDDGGRQQAGSTPAPSAAGEERLPLRIDLIAPAMSAVDEALGAPQHYFEVNATAQLVNLFVVPPGAAKAVAYVYRADTGLADPADGPTVSGPTFRAVDVAFADSVLEPVLAELPTSLPRLFAVDAVEGGAGVEYRVYFVSSQGGEVAVLLAPDGAVLSTELG